MKLPSGFEPIAIPSGDPPGAPSGAAADARPVAAVLDPELFMAARCGKIERLSELLSPIEGDSLLHVVAACGDGDEHLHRAKMISGINNRLLIAHNNKGDTPLHCAAAAGNANMVACLLDVAVAAEAAGGETSVKEFVGMRNKRGETALHQAVRAAS
ncbi:hypothetical protein ACP70R_050205 [Stipagrostis hirtigluma subsp. patula]